MSDLYDDINIGQAPVITEEPEPLHVKEDKPTTDDIEELNQFPEPVEANKDLSLPQDAPRTTVDFFQVHTHAEDFNTTNGLFSIYDPVNPDRQLYDIVEQEAIEITSPPIKWYELQLDQQDIDPLYNEAKRRDAYADPIVIFGNYEDSSFAQELTKYGINQPEELDIWFNLNYLLNKLGKGRTNQTASLYPIKNGDILQTYDSKIWEVTAALVLDEPLWRAQHLNIKVIRVQPQGIFLPDYGPIERFPTKITYVKK